MNDGAKKFELAKSAPGTLDTPLKRTFRNRTWELDIELDNRVLKSKLRNRTDRLQMLGANKTMRLKVWLDDPKLSTSQPFEYRIGGELVKGSGELIPKVVPDIHKIPAGADGAAIYQIEQILDEITVPVRLIRRSRSSGSEIPVSQTLRQNRLRYLLVQSQPLRLPVLLIPIQPQPRKALKYRIQRLLCIPLNIGVVNPKDHRPAMTTGIQPVKDERTGTADMKIARRRGRKPDS